MDAADLGKDKLDEWPPKGCRSINSFKILFEIGEGTHGKVYKAEDIKTGEIVALKEIKKKHSDKGISLEERNAKRETGILSRLKHKNVIHLKEIVTSGDGFRWGTVDNKFTRSIYLVLEYMDHDLEGLLNRLDVELKVPHVKCYMKQLLEGLCYCHNNQVLHRDIKVANILINSSGILKLADFSISCRLTDRDYSGPALSSTQNNRNLTREVVTLEYRPPELLLQTKERCDYGPAIDIWSAGCIFARLNGKQVMHGKDEADQLLKIYELCGSANEGNWPGVSKLPNYHRIKPGSPKKRRIGEVFQNLEPAALALLDKMLTLNPSEISLLVMNGGNFNLNVLNAYHDYELASCSKRISAKDALKEAYFFTYPLPSDPKSLPKYKSLHGTQPANRARSNLPFEQTQGPNQPKDKSQLSSATGSSQIDQTERKQIERSTKRSGC